MFLGRFVPHDFRPDVNFALFVITKRLKLTGIN